MTDGTLLSKASSKKRGQGRPAIGDNDVGRERLLIATEKLLRELPPARVTISRIAQEANVDPALVRYYFGNRAALLVAVVDRVTAHPRRAERMGGEPVAALANHIARTVDLVERAPFLHRLINEELKDVGTEESRARVRGMNLELVEYYRQLFAADDGRQLVEADPRFLHCVVLGACDFFALTETLIFGSLPDETDKEKLTAEFQQFLIKLVLNGVLRR